MNTLSGRLSDKKVAAIIAVFFTVGIIGHFLAATLPIMIFLTPWVLLVFGALVYLRALPRHIERTILLWTVGTYLFTFGLEAAGVATGIVFGEYRYGATLGLKLLEVPVVIGFNWTIIVFALSAEVFRRVDNPLFGALVTGGAAVLFDWVMEPAAIALDYWHWEGGAIPVQNYLAWFVIAALCSCAYRLLRITTSSAIGIYYVAIQLIFFIMLRIGGVSI